MIDSSTGVEPLPWTGERYLPDVRGNIELEHVHRYLIASRLTHGLRVLDIACGEGYGSALLARTAMHVVGVDIAADAVAHASSKYQATNLQFKTGSCAAIPLPDQSIDVVVSFETIEHHDQHDAMMQEIKRVLVPGGLLVISSPDRLEYSDKPGYSNPFHVKELYREQFDALLKKFFRNHHISGQKIVYGSAILSEERSGEIGSFDINDAALLPSPGIGQALYLVAVASDADLPTPLSGILEQRIDQSPDVREGIRQIRELANAQGERDARIADLNAALSERDARIAHLNGDLADRDVRLADLSQALDARAEQVAGFDASISERDMRLRSLSRSLGLRDEKITRLNQTLDALEARIAAISQAAEGDRRLLELEKKLGSAKDAQIALLEQRVAAIIRSRSWRATRVLRLFGHSARACRQVLREAFDRLSSRFRVTRRESIERIRQSDLFDPIFYTATHADVRDAGVDPATHYLLTGWKELRNPSARFSTAHYLQDHPDVAAARVNPLLHYIDRGRAEQRRVRATEGFAPSFNLPPMGALATTLTPAEASSTNGTRSAAAAVIGPSATDQIEAEMADIERSGLFDESYYRAMYTDVRTLADPLRHYCEHGWREGRNPSDDFDTRGYLETYADIKNAGMNPFWHYVIAGVTEARQAVPESSLRFEDDVRFRDLKSDIQLVAYYQHPSWERVQRFRKTGARQRLVPHADLGFYAQFNENTFRKQAILAERHGLRGWCFPLASTNAPAEAGPLRGFLNCREVRIGFCVDVDLRYGAIDGRAIDVLRDALTDDRYIRIDDRPVLVVTLPEGAAECARAWQTLDSALKDTGSARPYRIARCAGEFSAASPEALLDLPIDPVPGETGAFPPLRKHGVDRVPYGVVASNGVARIEQGAKHLPVYHGITIGRDDAPANPDRPLRYSRFGLKDYRRWLDAAIASARTLHAPDRRLVFLNAWNDWDHGTVLEPDRVSGYCKLNETSRALLGWASGLALPSVSVVVPNFNHAPYLRRRLDSIYRQTYPNIHVTLLDDCSTDDSRSILAEYAERYPNFTTVQFNDRNSGSVFRQWAKGIKGATGDIVWIAESDDYCDENFLSALVRCFDDEAVMLAYSKVEFVHEDESIMPGAFSTYVRDLDCYGKWAHSYSNTAHREVGEALGIVNTIPNVSGAIFRRPLDLPLLDDDDWLSMAVVGDWIFYLHLLRGGKLAYSVDTTNYFRRHDNSTAATTYRKKQFYRELSATACTVQALYDVSEDVIWSNRQRCKALYEHFCVGSDDEFLRWYDESAVFAARASRTPNLLVSTMSFHPGGAEILPIRIANELKRKGHSVLLLSVGLNEREEGVRRMLRSDVPVVETADIAATKAVIRDFGIEILNSHQWHVQKYPAYQADVFLDLKAHVASLHGMIEHGDAFAVTASQLSIAHENVSTWVYTADKNLGPFIEHGFYDEASLRFMKLPNGMSPPPIRAIPRSEIGMPESAFILCCVSRAIPEKGWVETIEAVDLARRLSGEDIRLILVGNGPVHDDYCRTGVPDFVYLAGFSEDAVGHYATADLGIMLTRFRSESFPLTIVDCLFAGKPFVSCDVGEIRNMLTLGSEMAGEVVSLQDWTIPVREVAEILVAYATNGRDYARACAVVPKLVERYRIDNVVARYVEIFQSARPAREQGSPVGHLMKHAGAPVTTGERSPV